MKLPSSTPSATCDLVSRLATLGLTLLIVLTLALVVSTPVKAAEKTAQPLTVSLSIFKEKRSAAADGSTTVTLVPAVKAIPGDRLVYVLTYTNTGSQPLGDVVVNYPLPQGVTYRAADSGSLVPMVSADGATFAPSAGEAPVVALRWHIPTPIAAGAHGEIAFKANFN